MKKLLIISKKWRQGRGRFTSIERFCEILDPDFHSYHGERAKVPPYISRFFKSQTNSRRTSKYSGPYNSHSFELELWGLKRALRTKPDIVFFPYADYDFYYWRYFKKILKIKTVLWSFFSENELRERFVDFTHFAEADLVLVAGKSQLNWFKEHASSVNAVHFPIGVDTEFFVPSDSFDPMRVVHVGSNRRDFKTLIRAMDIVFDQFAQLKLDLIGAQSRSNEIPERCYITIHPQLSDEEYLKVLQSANFSILSLEDGGSSNSLLETSSCGLPLIVTALQNVRDYYNESFSMQFEHNDHSALAENCNKLLRQPSLRQSMAFSARQNALKYDWHALLKEFKILINSV